MFRNTISRLPVIFMILCLMLIPVALINRQAKKQTVPTATTADDHFSEERLIEMIISLNLKFPHIVLAQGILETGRWESKLFKYNNNLFGMREARVRINTAAGTRSNHAYYNSWRESLYDYAFYQCRYLSRVKTEDEYFEYLSKNYAESENYVNAVKSIIESYNLRDLFHEKL